MIVSQRLTHLYNPGNKSPYEMIPKGDEDWEWLMQLTGMDAIPADAVHLNPALIKHKP